CARETTVWQSFENENSVDSWCNADNIVDSITIDICSSEVVGKIRENTEVRSPVECEVEPARFARAAIHAETGGGRAGGRTICLKRNQNIRVSILIHVLRIEVSDKGVGVGDDEDVLLLKRKIAVIEKDR